MSETADKREASDDTAQRFYTPMQIAMGSLFGTFAAAFWMVAANYRKAGARGRSFAALGVCLIVFVAVTWALLHLDITMHLQAILGASLLTTPAGFLQQKDGCMARRSQGTRPQTIARTVGVGFCALLFVVSSYGCFFYLLLFSAFHSFG